MSDEDSTCVMKMISDLRSGTRGYRRNSGMSSGLRLSSAAITPRSSLDNMDDDKRTPQKRPRLDDSEDVTLNKSGGESPPGTPFEWMRLKAENMSLRTRLSHQNAAVEKLHKVRKEIEEIFESQKNSLDIQADQDRQSIKQLEARVDVLRRTVQEAKEGQARAEKELTEVKSKMDNKIAALLNENVKLQEEVQQALSQSKSSSTKDDSSNEIAEALAREQAFEVRIQHLEECLKQSRAAQEKQELLAVENQNMKLKIEKLESEYALWEEGKLVAGRAARAGDLERELKLAKDKISTLREAVNGKLLLEEQISDLKQRLEHTDRVEQQVAMLEAKQSELLARLLEYETIGITGGPSVLKRELNRLQQAEMVLTAEEGQLRSKVQSLQRELQDSHKKYDEAKKMVCEMTNSRERLNKLVSRLQKKMMLVTRERDSYRQQLDMYEKEMTTVDGNTAITERIPALERAIDGYRELVAKLEADLETRDNSIQKGEFLKLRAENERLKGELEHRALKGDFNCNARVLHFRMNPAVIAGQLAEEKQQALLKEVEELRARVASGGIGLGPIGSSLHAQEIAELKQTHEIKMNRLKEAFKASSQEYRQACYQLFGWRVDRTKESMYKLSSQYAESSEDFLFFHVGEDGVNLLETAFSATIGSLIEQYLNRQHSVPMFLNAVQTELFSQQTVTNVLG